MGENFKNGGSHLEGIGAYMEYTAKTGKVGYDADANDSAGSCYWADKDNMDPIWQYHDSRIGEHELGFKDNAMKGNKYVRVDCDDLSAHNQRIASGYEPGANNNFTGIVTIDENGKKTIDPSIYNQRTSGGQPECVTDQFDACYGTFSGPQIFNDPNELAQKHCVAADQLLNAPEYDGKQADITAWNAEAAALQNRMSGEQDYLKGRIADHESRMSQFPEGSLEYNRAKENRDWCREYCAELEVSKSLLEAKQNELNGGMDQTASPVFNPNDYKPPVLPSSEAPGIHIVTGIE